MLKTCSKNGKSNTWTELISPSLKKVTVYCLQWIFRISCVLMSQSLPINPWSLCHCHWILNLFHSLLNPQHPKTGSQLALKGLPTFKIGSDVQYIHIYVLRCVSYNRSWCPLDLHYHSSSEHDEHLQFFILNVWPLVFWDISPWTTGLVRGKICANDVAILMVIKLIRCHPLGTANILIKLQSNLASRCKDISLWTEQLVWWILPTLSLTATIVEACLVSVTYL